MARVSGIDTDGNQLQEGDAVEIARMDDPTYAALVGVRGTVHMLVDNPDIQDDNLVIVDELADNPHALTGVSTFQKWVRKVGD